MIDMFRKKPVLQYESAVEAYPNIITPAKNHVPEWYKKIPKWKNNEIFTLGEGFNLSLKHCVPFLESLTTGYMVVLPYDLYVKDNEGVPFLTWNNVKNPPQWRETLANINLVPVGHYPMEYTWKLNCSFVVPKNYSMMMCHPINRFDLPFTTITGIIEGGFVTQSFGNIPFYIKKGFEGIIPQGTPIIQIIPFCQEKWLSKTKKGLVDQGELNNNKTMSVISGWYKKTFWTRKTYD
jgi:hypothetical protein